MAIITQCLNVKDYIPYQQLYYFFYLPTMNRIRCSCLKYIRRSGVIVAEKH